MKKLPVENFLDLLAAAQPTPAGGSVSALIGAMGAALVSMVARLTVNKDKYAHAHEGMVKVLETSEVLRVELTEAMQQDIKAYNKVISAYALPSQGADKAKRNDAIQAAFKEATEAPLTCIRLSLQVIPLARQAVQDGNASAVADAAVAAIAAYAALRGAALNVITNCSAIEDQTFCATAIDEANHALAEGARLETEVFELARRYASER